MNLGRSILIQMADKGLTAQQMPSQPCRCQPVLVPHVTRGLLVSAARLLFVHSQLLYDIIWHVCGTRVSDMLENDQIIHSKMCRTAPIDASSGKERQRRGYMTSFWQENLQFCSIVHPCCSRCPCMTHRFSETLHSVLIYDFTVCFYTFSPTSF